MHWRNDLRYKPRTHKMVAEFDPSSAPASGRAVELIILVACFFGLPQLFGEVALIALCGGLEMFLLVPSLKELMGDVM